ncbi:MAG: motility associated factor glycosyltransferase family protein [Spirochaetaceae bacterium]
MEKSNLLKQNLLALSSSHPALSVEVGRVKTSTQVKFRNARNGLLIPVLSLHNREYPLHSTIDPGKEGERFYSSSAQGGYLVFFGLGAGYHIRPFLQRNDISGILIIDFDLTLFRSILLRFDIRDIILDRRVRFLIDPTEEQIVEDMLHNYLPAVSGNLRFLRLRSRVRTLEDKFASAGEAMREVINPLTEDYSVQSYFGKRWFYNTIMNLRIAEHAHNRLPPLRKALITAAGPSLEKQLDRLIQERKGGTLIATDTSLPFLLYHKIIPDLVISIDCQHITYHHFIQGYPSQVPLILDLASPRHLTELSDKPVFFTSGHPFSRYVNRKWRKFPHIDTSGGNVSHAAVSLADSLGAQNILLFGADFSFPRGKSYSRGTYLYPHFRSQETRLMPSESLFFNFIFRNPEILHTGNRHLIRYTTKPMISYKKRLEEASEGIKARVLPIEGDGEKLCPAEPAKRRENSSIVGTLFTAGSPSMSWRDFLKSYDSILGELPKPTESLAGYRSQLSEEQIDVVTTLFPTSAAVRREQEILGHSSIGACILEDVISWSRSVIAHQLSSGLK